MAAVLYTAAVLFAPFAGAGTSSPTYDLEVAFDIPRARVIGTAIIDLPVGTELSIDLGDLRVIRMTNGDERIAPDEWPSGMLEVQVQGILRIQYEGTFSGQKLDVIDADKILLRGTWYPVAEGTYRFRLRATVPADFTAVSEGDRVDRTEARGEATYAFDLPYPQPEWAGITFVASRLWASRDATYRDVPLSVHLLSRNAPRLDETVRQAQRYLQQLEALLGAYPFKRLVVVENPVGISYSLAMPTYVLLSQRSVAADAAEDSALNHEIAHSWFGNAVLASYVGGNWAEGLTAYFSDHLENERLGRAWQRRQRMMAANQSFVVGRANVPLSSFDESHDRASNIIGYAKAALVVHMLRREAGDEDFFAAMRSFLTENLYRQASWAELRKAFERTTATDFSGFFRQWVEGTATADLGLEGVSASSVGKKHELRLTVVQKGPVLALTVPLTIYFENGRSTKKSLKVSGQRNSFKFALEQRPVRIVVDEDYDVLRRLTIAEVPPMIATLMARPRVTIIGTSAEQAKFSSLIGALDKEGAASALTGEHREWTRRAPIFKSGAVPRSDAKPPQRVIARSTESTAAIAGKRSSLILLGEHEPLIRLLFGRLQLPDAGLSLVVLKHPRSPGDFVAVFRAASKSEVDGAAEKLVDRPRYTSATFSGGKLTSYELKNGDRGISRNIPAVRR